MKVFFCHISYKNIAKADFHFFIYLDFELSQHLFYFKIAYMLFNFEQKKYL
jgi:hypothetical protein